MPEPPAGQTMCKGPQGHVKHEPLARVNVVMMFGIRHESVGNSMRLEALQYQIRFNGKKTLANVSDEISSKQSR